MTFITRRGWLGVLIVALIAAIAATTMTVARARSRDAVMRADPETIFAQPDLLRPALAAGRTGFASHCASCHGDGRGNPARGIPDLTDHDFLYGTGQVAEIEQIVLHGIRSGDSRGWHLAAMPGYAQARPYPAEPAIAALSPSDIADVTQWLLRRRTTGVAAVARGKTIYAGRGACWDCHGPDGGGNPAIGAPNLNDDVWLYGGSAAALTATLARGHAGSCPAFARVVTPAQARAIAVYVAALPRRSAG